MATAVLSRTTRIDPGQVDISGARVSDISMPRVAILDVDGTLVDTNYHHAIAWFRAFRRHFLTLQVWRIHRHIGIGDSIRAAESELYRGLIGEVQAMEGSRRLIEDLKDAGNAVVLASSAKEWEVEHYLELLDAKEIVDDWTTSADVERTKPEPDLVQAALDKVGGRPEDAMLIGDTVWDVEAAHRAGVETLAVRTGGFSDQELSDAGAREVFTSVEELRKSLLETPLRS
jgi:HAD superfamily hydrolase (TIGR01509 family)